MGTTTGGRRRIGRRSFGTFFSLLLILAVGLGQAGLVAGAAIGFGGGNSGGSSARGGSVAAAPAVASLDAGKISLDFVAAGPFTYDHSDASGPAAFGNRTISKTAGVVESLEGGDFACGDLVVFFTQIVVGAGAGSGAIDLDYVHDGETTSGGKVGFNDLISATISSPDSGNKNLNGNEGVAVQSESFITSGKDRLETTIRVNGVDGGETIILRTVVKLACALDAGKVTGNIHSAISGASVVGGARISVGQQTIPLKQAGDILQPGINIVKSCPPDATVGDTITYSITVTNNGQDALSNVVVNDPLLGGNLAGFPSNMSAGQVVTQTFQYTVGASPDPLTNTATVTATAAQSGTTVEDSSDCIVDVLFPDLDIEKTADNDVVDAGDPIGYTITVTNNGPGVAKGVVMTDTLPTNAGLSWSFNQVQGGWNCSITSGVLSCGGPNFNLASGASASVHIYSPTTKATCGVVSNSASASAGNHATVNVGPVTVTVLCAELDVAKTADEGTVNAGEDIGYTITVTNGGAGTAKDVVLTDTLPTNAGLDWTIDGGTGAADCSISGGVLTCDFGDLASGEIVTVHISSPTTPDTCGVVSNSVSVTSSNDGNPSDGPENITVLCPDVSVEKTADTGTISAGDEAAFTIVVTNHGDGVAKDVTLVDTLPAGVDWNEDSADCSISGGVLTCDFGDLDPGESRTIHVTGDTDATDCGELVNVATVSASNEDDDDAGDNQSEATITVECPGIQVDKTPDADVVDAAELIGFTITVMNNGPGIARDVILTDTLPANDGLSWTIDGGTGAADCSIAGGVLTCDFGDMADGDSYTVHISSDTDFTSCGTVDNTAVVTISNGDGDEDDASIVVNCPEIGIDIEKGGPDLAHVGDTLTYTFGVQLTTDEPLYDVVVTDPNCNEGAPQYVSGDDGDSVLEPGEVWSYTCTHVVTEDGPDPLPNTATVQGTSDDGRTVTDQDDHVVDLIHPDIRIVKTVNPDSGNPGDIVTYSYEVTNTGDTTLSNVTVVDDVLGDIGTIDVLEPGETVTLTKDWPLPSDEVIVVNVAVASGTDVLGKTVVDDDDANVTIVIAETPPTPPPPTAFTGFDALRYGMLAGALLALGLSALMVARRRRTDTA